MFVVVFFCFLILFLVSAAGDEPEITVKPGQDVPLQCQGLRNACVTLLEWVRPDLKSDGYVFFYRNERPYKNYQHPSFHGRVELRDPEMKDGDASVVLKNVTINDTGTYKCRIITNTRREIKQLTNLKVTDSDHTAEDKEGFRSIVVGLSVFSVLLVVVVIVCISCICRNRRGLLKHVSYELPEKVEHNLQELK